MPEFTCGQRDACVVCGGDQYRDAHFALGRIFCAECWRSIEACRRKRPPVQQTLNLVQATQRSAPNSPQKHTEPNERNAHAKP